MKLGQADFQRLSRGRLVRLGLFGGRPRRNTADSFKPSQILELARRDVDWLENRGNHLLPVWSDAYPALLRQIYNPPFVLFVRALRPQEFNGIPGPVVSIVGTRKPSARGLELTREMARDCAANGALVVSGLAMGIDAAAHRGALDAHSRTVAFLGHGCDHVYPRIHFKLAASMLEAGGALLSEYPPGTAARPYRFPQRNRLIAGIAHLVLLAEAPRRSGALITVDYALDQGRDVAVLAGLSRSRRNEGGRDLVECGAPLVSSAAELFNELNGYGENALNCRE